MAAFKPTSINGVQPLFIVGEHLETLATGEGCFPLDLGSFNPKSDCPLSVFEVLTWVGGYLAPYHDKCPTPEEYFGGRSTKIDFAENQLYASSIGFSPLTTAHRCLFPQTSVRSSVTYMLSTWPWLDHLLSGLGRGTTRALATPPHLVKLAPLPN